MWMGNLKAAGAAIAVVSSALALGACGSSGNDTTKPPPPPVSAATADHLAKLSTRVASDLDAGETCSAAIAADELRTAVEESDLPQTVRPGVETVAANLVNQVNCPPPPPPPEKKKPKDQHHGDEHHGGGQHGDEQSSGPPGHSGGLPPGQAKLKGEG